MSIPQRYIKNYFKRFADAKALLETAPSKDVRMRIVIPCHNEPDLLGTLNALCGCETPASPVEVIIVLNDGEQHVDTPIREQNQKTLAAFHDWKAQNRGGEHLQFFMLEALGLPQKHAGVGLARKWGMDEALRRFVATESDGSIICLDADCRVSQNYLRVIEQEFQASNFNLGMVNFKHRMAEGDSEELKKGIAYYESFLHYYVRGLAYAEFPFAIQTIGSCMLVKASVYAKHGGMNQRKAGEDFYFLHKIIPHEPFVEIRSTTVYPSCRVSDRVPFGTGRAQQQWLNQSGDVFYTYDPQVFKALKKLLEVLASCHDKSFTKLIQQLPTWSQAFLQTIKAEEKLGALKKNSTSFTQFHKHLFVWFDGFMCLKFVHHARDHAFPNVPLDRAEQELAVF